MSEYEIEVWPPRWKELMDCPQMRCNMIDEKLYDLNLEDVPDIGDLRKFLHQIRHSRGYEVDCHPPQHTTRYGLWADPPKYWKSNHTLMARVRFALDQINAQAQKHGESYQLQDIVRIVETRRHRSGLLTFNVKEVTPNTGVVKTVQAMVFNPYIDHYELREWRFRPGPPETPPQNSLDICSKGIRRNNPAPVDWLSLYEAEKTC